MILSFLFFLFIFSFQSFFTLSSTNNRILSKDLYNHYTKKWIDEHKYWIQYANDRYSLDHLCKLNSNNNNNSNKLNVEYNNYTLIFPVCKDNILIDDYYSMNTNFKNDINSFKNIQDFLPCDTVKCFQIKSTSPCSFTPSDSIDYFPPLYIPSSNEITSPIHGDVSLLDSNAQSGKNIKFFEEITDEIIELGSIINSHTLNFDQDIPPFFSKRTNTLLKINGKILLNAKEKCIKKKKDKKLKITLWQTNSLLETQIKSNFEKDSNNLTKLKEISKSLDFFTDNDGNFSVWTYLPFSYGPPRHIMILVEYENYKSILTRLYFDSDIRLNQLLLTDYYLKDYNDDEKKRKIDEDINSLYFENEFNIKKEYYMNNVKVIKNDLRVMKVNLIKYSNINSDEQFVKGYLEINPTLSLQPERELNDLDTSNQYSDSIDDSEDIITLKTLKGFWLDETSGLIEVNLIGNIFYAREYPHYRSWGNLYGIVKNNIIYSITFPLNSFGLVSNEMKNLESFKYIDNNVKNVDSKYGIISSFNTLLKDSIRTSLKIQFSFNNNNLKSWYKIKDFNEYLVSGSNSIGLSTDASYLALSKDSSDFDFESIQTFNSHSSTNKKSSSVSSVLSSSSLTYRYLKLEIYSLGGDNDIKDIYKSDQLIINEVEFYSSFFSESFNTLNHESNFINKKLFPTPNWNLKSLSFKDSVVKITCSSYISKYHHCYKIFDNNSNSSSSWITKSRGIFQNNLTKFDYFILDLGKGNGILPSAMRIICNNNGNVDRKGGIHCPFRFSLFGSNNNKYYNQLFSFDGIDYKNLDYKLNVGKLFYFHDEIFLTSFNGEKCPSCFYAPYFTCNLDRYDSGCQSKYCNKNGYCDKQPSCPLGTYSQLISSPSSTISSSGISKDPVINQNLISKFQCMPCAPGYFGNKNDHINSYCSGICDEGYYCPSGSTSSTEKLCNDPQYYCPRGASSPIPVPSGKYSISRSNNSLELISIDRFGNEIKLYSAIEDCPKGSWCKFGIKSLCPVGFFGNETNLSNELCVRNCIAGTYCPEGTVDPITCPSGHYCPDGKNMIKCPSGTFGNSMGLTTSDCSGLCPLGHYCLEGTIDPFTYPCPNGVYGDSFGLKTEKCSNICPPGYYCPVATKKSTQFPCGNSTVYCPEGSSFPTLVSPGFYSQGGNSTTRSYQIETDPGEYAWNGVKYPCPAGSYGNSKGLNANDDEFDKWVIETFPIPNSPQISDPTIVPTFYPTNIPTSFPTLSPTINPTYYPYTVKVPYSSSPYFLDINDPRYSKKYFKCTDLCPPGYFCPEKTSNYNKFPCPRGRYGSTPGLKDSYCTAICPVGHYCPTGSINPIPCPAGRFGNSTGLFDSSCSSKCVDIKNANDSEDPYNPYSCDTDSSLCHEGFYCPIGSISPNQYSCGDPSVYCPIGSSNPLNVSLGYYSFGGDSFTSKTSQKLCEEGWYCDKGLKIKCPSGTYGISKGLFNNKCSGLCPLGHYCPEGTVMPKSFPCPAGRYGNMEGLNSRGCTDACSPGYHCPPGSKSQYELPCGILREFEITENEFYNLNQDTLSFYEKLIINSKTLYYNVDFNTTLKIIKLNNKSVNKFIIQLKFEYPNEVYCPLGSIKPILVLPGYYSILGNSTTRQDQLECPIGSYCKNGIRYSCPGGRFGSETRLTSPDCSGICSKGHYCPSGSTSSKEYLCPIGRYGKDEGLSSASCSGICQNALNCPAGSIVKG